MPGRSRFLRSCHRTKPNSFRLERLFGQPAGADSLDAWSTSLKYGQRQCRANDIAPRNHNGRIPDRRKTDDAHSTTDWSSCRRTLPGRSTSGRFWTSLGRMRPGLGWRLGLWRLLCGLRLRRLGLQWLGVWRLELRRLGLWRLSRPVGYLANTARPATTVAASAADDSAMLTVSVPADARVFVNGHATTSTGETRTYISRNLRPGATYTYTSAHRVDPPRPAGVRGEDRAVQRRPKPSPGIRRRTNKRPDRQHGQRRHAVIRYARIAIRCRHCVGHAVA